MISRLLRCSLSLLALAAACTVLQASASAQSRKAAPASKASHTKAAPAPAVAPKVQEESPVGRWVARHGVNDDLQLWWQFKPNGTVTVAGGAIVRNTYKLEGTTLTIGKTPAGGATVFDVLFDSGKLYTKAHTENPPTMQFTRIGPPGAPPDSIVGQWRMSDSVPSADPQQEAIRQRMSKMIVSYRADGSYEARIPFDQIDGTWDAKTRTYTLKNYPALPYDRQGPGLILVNPLKQTEKHTYYIDQFF